MNDFTTQTQHPNATRPDRRLHRPGSPWTSELYECTCGQEIATTRAPITDRDDYVHRFDGQDCDYHSHAAGRRTPVDHHIIRPGSICADHGCTTVHPGCTHIDSVKQHDHRCTSRCFAAGNDCPR